MHGQPRLGPRALEGQARPFFVVARFLLYEPMFSTCPAQKPQIHIIYQQLEASNGKLRG